MRECDAEALALLSRVANEDTTGLVLVGVQALLDYTPKCAARTHVLAHAPHAPHAHHVLN